MFPYGLLKRLRMSVFRLVLNIITSAGTVTLNWNYSTNGQQGWCIYRYVLFFRQLEKNKWRMYKEKMTNELVYSSIYSLFCMKIFFR
jgi:hypothetical protein